MFWVLSNQILPRIIARLIKEIKNLIFKDFSQKIDETFGKFQVPNCKYFD